MRAITDIPAKTPRPIGNTESLVPGSWKAAALEVVESAAEVPEGELAAAAAGEMVLEASEMLTPRHPTHWLQQNLRQNQQPELQQLSRMRRRSTLQSQESKTRPEYD